MADDITDAASTAIAAFTLAQLAFWSAFQSGLVSKAEAERMLRDAIAANKTGGEANQLAARKLEEVLKMVSQSEQPKRQ
ncbi:MAG: hypothetical protein C5B58_07420 [Acidobacteria bacterium]|nr:MAG: hypothetical protein C5B58_07420 [Acidobacteriota bacterium]